MFVAGFGPITQNIEANKALYRDLMELPLKSFENTPYYVIDNGALEGVKHFAMWPLSMAAQSCFKCQQWPENLPVPQAWIEFDVEDLDQATECLKRNNINLLIDNHEEPWGQSVTRFLDPQGILIALTHTPWLRAGP